MAKLMSDEEYRSLPREQRQFLPRNRSATIENFNEEARTAQISFASETPVKDMWGDDEILRCDDASVNTERFDKGVMPILFNHKRDSVIGKPLRIWTENHRAFCEIEFANTGEANKIFELVRDGFMNGVSVGYRVLEWTYAREGEVVDGFTGPCYIAQRWEVFEISIVSVPADPNVGVGREMADFNNQDMGETPAKNERGQRTMDPNERDQQPIQNPADTGAAGGEERQVTASGVSEAELENARQAEQERCTNIIAMCAEHGIDDKQRDAWITGKTGITIVQRELLGILSKRNKPINANIQIGEDQAEKKRELLRDGVLLRAGVTVANPVEGADKYRGMTMQMIAREMLMEKGERGAMQMDPNELFHRAMTTTSLPLLLNDITQASLREGYASADTTFERWVDIANVPDFREHHSITVGLDGEPIKIPENGEFTATELKEAESFMRIDTYGRKYSYTRQAFINDDLSVLTTIPRRLGRKFPIVINRMAYGALAGGDYTAGINLGTAGEISTETLSEAMKLLRMRKDPLSGEYLRIRPRYLVVPVAQEAKAAQFLASTADPAANNSGVKNIYNGALTIISDPELDAINSNAWYLLGAPVGGEGVQVAFLNGNRTPILEGQTSFDVLGWQYRMYLDFGVKRMSTLGYVKNAGEA